MGQGLDSTATSITTFGGGFISNIPMTGKKKSNFREVKWFSEDHICFQRAMTVGCYQSVSLIVCSRKRTLVLKITSTRKPKRVCGKQTLYQTSLALLIPTLPHHVFVLAGVLSLASLIVLALQVQVWKEEKIDTRRTSTGQLCGCSKSLGKWYHGHR